MALQGVEDKQKKTKKKYMSGNKDFEVIFDTLDNLFQGIKLLF